jgi:hypothetical protein
LLVQLRVKIGGHEAGTEVEVDKVIRDNDSVFHGNYYGATII